LLKTIDRQGGRVLVFSAYTQSLDLLENYVKTSGYSFLRMDGKTPRHKRQDLADEFNSSPGILLFLLSTKAMGLGLNLTSANFVIIFDVEWNPSWDSQAQDRSYRIGQKRDVTVFRLVSRGTLEEQKYLRQVYKTQLKKETMVDVANSERERAVRIFRGVANDPSRRGELFGLSNLLRHEDGCLMKYGAEAKEARQFGHGIYSVESIVEAAKKTVPAEDGLEEDETIGVPDIAKRCERMGAYQMVYYQPSLKTLGADSYMLLLLESTPDEEAKEGGESESEDEMIGAESQFVLDMYDKDGDALAGNDANTATSTSDVGTMENGHVADSVPSLAKSDAAAGASGTGQDIAPNTADIAVVKREMADSTPYGNVSSTGMAKLPEISSSAKLDTSTTMDGVGGGIVSVASTKALVVKQEMDDSPTSGDNESSKATATAKSSTIDVVAPVVAVNHVAVTHEMDDSPTPGDQMSDNNTAARAAAVIPIMPKPVEQAYRMRNVMLAGMSTNHIRDGQTKPTFSIYDFGFTSDTV
jgi:Helicase conserved C-terminal domain